MDLKIAKGLASRGRITGRQQQNVLVDSRSTDPASPLPMLPKLDHGPITDPMGANGGCALLGDGAQKQR